MQPTDLKALIEAEKARLRNKIERTRQKLEELLALKYYSGMVQ